MTIFYFLGQTKYSEGLVLTRKSCSTTFFQRAAVSLLFETELQTRARWKGYCRESSLETRSGRPNPLGAHTGAPNAPFSQISWGKKNSGF